MTSTQPDFTKMDPEHEAARQKYIESTEASMRANGVEPEENVVVEFGDYWATPEPERWYFPDRKQYIEFQPMTESMRQDYQGRTMTTMSMNRASGDQKIGINVARDRRALIDVSVTGWFFRRGGEEVGFKNSQFGFKKWLEIANPKHIEALEKAIRKANPWLQSDMDEEEIERQIEELKEQLHTLREQKAGELASSDR